MDNIDIPPIPRHHSNYGRRLVESRAAMKTRDVKSSYSCRSISSGMSPEAQIAMRQVMEEMAPKREHAGQSDTASVSTNSSHQPSSLKTSKQSPTKKKKQKHATFSEVYEKTTYSVTDGDITDRGFGYLDSRKYHDANNIDNPDSQEDVLDDDAIELIAQRNSVEKVAYWVDAHDEELPEPACITTLAHISE